VLLPRVGKRRLGAARNISPPSPRKPARDGAGSSGGQLQRSRGGLPRLFPGTHSVCCKNFHKRGRGNAFAKPVRSRRRVDRRPFLIAHFSILGGSHEGRSKKQPASLLSPMHSGSRAFCTFCASREVATARHVRSSISIGLPLCRVYGVCFGKADETATLIDASE
jgi:hypothetical protein